MALQVMPDATATAAPVTFSTLPHDVIRHIVRVADAPLNMRLISPTWNAMVLEYLAAQRPPIANVHLHSGSQYGETGVALKLLLTTNQYRGPIKGWCSEYDSKRVESPALRMQLSDPATLRRIIFCYAMVLLVLSILIFANLPHHRSIPIVVLIVCYQVYNLRRNWKEAKENRQRLSLVFSRCCSIRALHFHHLTRATRNIVSMSLGNIPIRHLVFHNEGCNHDLRETIVKLVQVHQSEKVSMCIKKFDAKELREFLVDVTTLAGELAIYETKGSADKIFGKRREFWQDMVGDNPFPVDILTFDLSQHSPRFYNLALPTNNLLTNRRGEGVSGPYHLRIHFRRECAQVLVSDV